MKAEKLVWNVYRYNVNQRIMESWNIFNHYSFCKSLNALVQKIKRKYKLNAINNNEFLEESVDKLLKVYFWSKSEYEIIIAPWPCYLDVEQAQSLIEKSIKDNYSTICINPKQAEKIDIYSQVKANFNYFIEYLNSKMFSQKRKNNGNK